MCYCPYNPGKEQFESCKLQDFPLLPEPFLLFLYFWDKASHVALADLELMEIHLLLPPKS